VAIGLTVALAALVAAGAALAATLTVSPSNLNGWSVVHDTCGAATTGSVAFMNGPGSPPAGTGSVQLTTGSNGDSYETLRTTAFDGVKLSNLTALDYWTYETQFGSGGQAAYLDLYVDFNGDNVRDDILTFEPVYQTSQGTVTLNTWQHWDALTGLWWSDALGGPPPLFTLATYVADHPNATILGGGETSFILASGCGGAAWSNFAGNADALTVGVSGSNTTFDFELNQPGPNPNHKVTICHKGHTISIDRHALPAHLRHGDHIGPCASAPTKKKKNKNR
jgi:hypothetical protein